MSKDNKPVELQGIDKWGKQDGNDEDKSPKSKVQGRNNLKPGTRVTNEGWPDVQPTLLKLTLPFPLI